MHSAGNITEKVRVSKFNCQNETVVDLFAGKIRILQQCTRLEIIFILLAVMKASDTDKIDLKSRKPVKAQHDNL